MQDVPGWLADNGFERFTELFAENEIDGEVLVELTDQDLKDLGLPLGARKKLLKAIAALGGETTSPAPPEPTAAIDDAPAAKPAPEAERRQLTVMFCDLVGSTALSGQLDPEELRAVILAYQNSVAGEVSRFDGHVAKFMGDGVLAYFGWPQAHEDDAERAVRAGMSIIQALASINAPGGQPLLARVGIATGLVVVGDLIGEGAAQEEAVVGETPNLAARLQALAKPGQIVLSDLTRGLLGDLFDLTDLGPQALKGIAQPTTCYAVLAERATESRFEAQISGGLAAMVGRDQELGLLQERWRQAKAGEGQMVQLTGEAGIGKSRISRALTDAVAAEDSLRINYQCSPYHSDSAFYPVIRQLLRAARFEATDSSETKLDKLEAVLAQGGEDQRQAAPLIAALLDLEGAEDRYGVLAMTPMQQRARTLEALVDQLIGLAAQQPVLLVIEDAHWIDPTTLDLLELSLDRTAGARVLILVTARPTFDDGFGGHPIVTRLALNRLGRAQVRAIIARVTGGKTLPNALVDEIAEKTDGVPLFIEELTKTVLETGILTETAEGYELAGPINALAIPASLHDSLMARLDRLQPVKEVAQTAACIGREFSYGLLASIAWQPEPDLRQALERLTLAELVFRRGIPPEASYTFKHALVRDAAYESLLKTRRQQIHARIFAALETATGTAPELLARHAEEAGMTETAIDYWQRAGEAANARPAYAEAIAQFRSAIRLATSLPDKATAARKEIELQVLLGQVLIPAHGYSAEPTVTAFMRARELLDEVGDTPLRFPIHYGNWVRFHVRTDTPRAIGAAEEMVAAAANAEDDGPRMVAWRILAVSRFMAGELRRADEHFEQSLALYDPEHHLSLAYRYGHEPGVGIRMYAAFNLWCLGYPERAWALADEGLATARKLGHIATLTYTVAHVAILATISRSDERAKSLLDEALALSEKHEVPMWRGFALAFAAPILRASGDHTQAAERFKRGVTLLDASDTYIFRPAVLTNLAAALTAGGQYQAAGAVLDEVREWIAKTGERWSEPEAYRVLGEVILAENADHTAEAEAAFRRAIELARAQEASSWELRAATSLARLWAERGEHAEARDLLQPILGRFTEGFDTPDLVEAKALIAGLD
jgi:predicted ATPase/class 3 adenylate cyclase